MCGTLLPTLTMTRPLFSFQTTKNALLLRARSLEHQIQGLLVVLKRRRLDSILFLGCLL